MICLSACKTFLGSRLEVEPDHISLTTFALTEHLLLSCIPVFGFLGTEEIWRLRLCLSEYVTILTVLVNFLNAFLESVRCAEPLL